MRLQCGEVVGAPGRCLAFPYKGTHTNFKYNLHLFALYYFKWNKSIANPHLQGPLRYIGKAWQIGVDDGRDGRDSNAGPIWLINMAKRNW